VINLRVATWNINGLSPNKHDIEILLQEHKLDIILVSETHCTAASNIKFQNCKAYLTNHPDGTAHAGTAIIIKDSIKHHLMPEYKTDHIQATTVAVEDACGIINFTSVYCPPKHKITEPLFTNFFQSLGNRFVAGGDWNSKHLYWGSRLTTTRGRQLKLSIDTNHLQSISSLEPTHWPTDSNKIPDLLDFFIVKGLPREFFKAESCCDGSSDHNPVLLTVSNLHINGDCEPRLYNRHTDWECFRSHIDSEINLNIRLKTSDDIDEGTRYITSLIQESCWLNTCPQDQDCEQRENRPLTIRCKIREKRRLRRIWHQTQLAADKTAFNKSARELKTMIQAWKNDTLQAKLESLTATAATNYSLWKFTKSHNRPQNGKVPIRKINGSWARTAKEKADTFGEHLATVFTPNDSADVQTEINIKRSLLQPLQLSLPPTPVKPREVWKIIRDMPGKKAPGFDLITKEVLQELPKKAIIFLTILFNAILRVQYYPQLWKVSQILMIHKLGKPANEVTSYRPISLLPILSKMFEKLLLHRLLPILEDNKVIPNHQFGFRQKHSTVEQVNRVFEKIRKTLEEKEYCSSAFLDIQQAFDRVWHDGLLYKIKNSLPHTYYLLMKSYLSGRLFQVKESGDTSRLYDIQAGVPQGSILGPILYAVYTSDLPQTVDVTICTYADDTALLASDRNPLTASGKLQRGLDDVTEWLQRWRIKASTTKSVQVTFSLKKGNCPPVSLDNAILPHTDSVRYLGLHLDRRLTWKNHIKAKREELNIRFKTLYWLTGRNSKLSVDNKLLIYTSILKPSWMYGIQLWGSACNSNISILQRMQNVILRTLAGVPWFIKNSEIHEHLQIPTVQEEIKKSSQAYRKRLKNHPNELAVELMSVSYKKRLKRKNVQDLHQDN
jgi:hypothetical protein